MGRWLSPDPSGLSSANLSDPQSLNLYSYVGNRPLMLTDLEGLCWKGFSWACMDWNRLKDAAIAFMGGSPGNPADQQQPPICPNCLQVESQHPGTPGGGGCSSNPMCEMAYRTSFYTRSTSQYLWRRKGPVLTVGANAISVYGAAINNYRIGLVGSGLGLMNHPDPQEIGLIGVSLVPGVDETAATLGAVYDGGKAVGNWITNNIMAPMLEAIPGPIIGVTADGQEVKEPDISDPGAWDGTN